MRLLFKVGLLLLCIMPFSLAYAGENLCYTWKGVNGDLLKNIQAHLQLGNAPCIKNLSPAQIISTYQTSKKIIRESLEPYGYFKSTSHSTLTPFNKSWMAIFYIELGPPLHITQIQAHVEGPGKNNKAIQDYINHIPLKQGDIFNTDNYTAAKDQLFGRAKNQGYIKAAFKNRILIDLKSNTCQIEMVLETGDRYYFGPVTFENTSVYSQAFLNRFINFTSAEPFSSAKLVALQQAMEHSYYFQEVIITPDFNHVDHHHIPVHFYFTVPKAKQYSFGVGYGTLTGARLTGDINLHHLTNTGHHFELQAKLSSILSSVTANYYIPGRNPLTDTYLFGANAKRFNPKAGKSDSATLSAGYLINYNKIKESITLNYLVERFIVYPLPARKSHLVYPNFKFIYLSADDIIHPQQGFSFTFTTQAGSHYLLSTTSFIQPLIKTKFIYSPFSFARFLLRGDFGYTAVHHRDAFPLSQRFFAGGINSIRGFADSSIGPGRYLEIASLEYQNKVINNLSAAVFYDIGTAADHFKEPWNRGVGVGLVYNTMIGPIKLYVARAVSKKTQPYSFEFSAGPEFS